MPCIARVMREYTGQVIRCAITDLAGLEAGTAHNPAAALHLLLAQAERWIIDGVELIQLRENHLSAERLFALARQLVHLTSGTFTRVLVNGRADVAVAAAAYGVHLPAHPGALTPSQVRQVFAAAGRKPPLVSVSCHDLSEVRRASDSDPALAADLLLFGPVFEKRVGSTLIHEGVGLPALQQAVLAAAAVPVLALGGVTADRIDACLATGAAGVAAIRLFTRPALRPRS